MIDLKNLKVWKTIEIEKDGKTVVLDLYSATLAEVGETTTETISATLVQAGFGGQIPPTADAAFKRCIEREPIGTAWLVIRGEADSRGRLNILYLNRPSYGAWAEGRFAYQDHEWYAEDRLVFCRGEEAEAA